MEISEIFKTMKRQWMIYYYVIKLLCKGKNIVTNVLVIRLPVLRDHYKREVIITSLILNILDT